MTVLVWHDENFVVEGQDGRRYDANSEDEQNASALRMLNEWVQWESVELSSADEKKASGILEKGDGAAAYDFVMNHSSQRVERR